MSGSLRVGLLDPSLESRNTGDLIIRQSVSSVLMRLGIDERQLLMLPTQRPLSHGERSEASRCDKFLVGGTNLLSSNMPWYMQWRLRPRDFAIFNRNVRLLGVGWWQYQGRPNRVTTSILRRVLERDGHAIRDAWSREQLAMVGIRGTNTACPTMWGLSRTPERSERPSRAVVVTLTDYNRHPQYDRALIDLLGRHYESIVFWPQGAKDAAYVQRVSPGLRILEQGLPSLDDALIGGCDYVGTRLHAGIRALQHGARSTVVAIDNRAMEISRDTGLPTIPRRLEEEASSVLFGHRRVEMAIPGEAIDGWLQSTRAWLESR